MNPDIKTLIAEGNYHMKIMIGKLTELLSVFEKRTERHYFDTYRLFEKLEMLEKYLGVKFEEKGVKTKGKYIKSK